MEMKNIEKLAGKQHSIWSHWMKYLFTQGSFKDGSFTIPKDKVERWTRQMNTDYKDLTEKEKESDREQVRKFIELM